MAKIGQLHKNTMILFVADGIAAVFSILISIILARGLGVEDFGKFTAAVSFTYILVLAIDSGMGQFVAIDVAREDSLKISDVNQLFTWRILLIVVLTLIAPFIIWMVLPSKVSIYVVCFLTPALCLVSLNEFFCWILKGTQKFILSAWMRILSVFLIFIFCLGVFWSPNKLMYTVFAYGAAGIIGSFVCFYLTSRFATRMRLVSLDKIFFIKVLPEVYKITPYIIASTIFTRFDVVLVAKYCDPSSTGFYSVASRLLDAMRLIPIAVYSVYLPVFSSVNTQKGLLRNKFLDAFPILIFCYAVVALTATLFVEPLTGAVIGHQYTASVVYFRPLLWGCGIMYLNMLITALLFVCNDFKTLWVGIGFALIMNIISNIILLPVYGAIAASWMKFASELILFAVLSRGLLMQIHISAYELYFKPAIIILFTIGAFKIMAGHPLIFKVPFNFAAMAVCFTIIFYKKTDMKGKMAAAEDIN